MSEDRPRLKTEPLTSLTQLPELCQVHSRDFRVPRPIQQALKGEQPTSKSVE